MVGIYKHQVVFLCANIAIILAYKLSIYLSIYAMQVIFTCSQSV